MISSGLREANNMKSEDIPNGCTSNCMTINGEGSPIVIMMMSLVMMSLIIMSSNVVVDGVIYNDIINNNNVIN